VLAQAVVQRITVQFTYQTPNAAAAVRTVDPYALARRRSRWYLIGYDHQRDGIRAFRLDRVNGNVTHISAVAAFDPPTTLDLAAELIPPIDDVHTISGDVAAEFAAQITARGGEVRVPSHALPHERLPFTLPAVDLVRDVPWLLAFGPALRVHSPQPVVDAMRASLHAVTVANGPAS
jgi:proteasome accessory factor B